MVITGCCRASAIPFHTKFGNLEIENIFQLGEYEDWYSGEDLIAKGVQNLLKHLQTETRATKQSWTIRILPNFYSQNRS